MNTRSRTVVASFLALFLTFSLAELIGAAFPAARAVLPFVRVLWLGAMAAVATGAVEAFRDRGTRRLAALNDLARRLRHPLDLQTILDTGVTRAVLLTEASAACIRLLDGEDGLLMAASVNVHPDYFKRNRRITLEQAGLSLPPDAADPIRLSGHSLRPELAGLLGGETAAMAVVIPMSGEGRTHGILTLVFQKRRRLLRDDLDALRIIGTQLGAAIASARAYDQLLHESQTDALTGLHSRRYFEEQYRREMARARRGLHPVSLAMIDIDSFKQINDRWGHVTGDQVLQAVGELLGQMRETDVVARYGGDEFVVLMPDTRSAEAEAVARRIREGLERLNAARRFPFPVQLSIGVRQLGKGDSDLLADADAEMYRMKQRRSRGRRQFVPEQPERREEEEDLEGEDRQSRRCAG